MEHIPSWEANSQEIPYLLWNPKVQYDVHKSPPLNPSWARWIQSTILHPISLRSILILPFHLCLGLPSGLFPSSFPTKISYSLHWLLKYSHINTPCMCWCWSMPQLPIITLFITLCVKNQFSASAEHLCILRIVHFKRSGYLTFTMLQSHIHDTAFCIPSNIKHRHKRHNTRVMWL